MNRIALGLLTACLLAAWHTSSSADVVYASYNSSTVGNGWTVRDPQLNQLNFVPTVFAIDGIAAGANNDVFLSAQDSLYRYTADGALLGSFTYGDPALRYSDITFKASNVYASYNSSTVGNGWTVRDVDLNQLNFVPTSFAIEGITAGDANDVFLAAADSLYHYTADGTLLASFTYGDPALSYSDITFRGHFVYASYNSVTVGNGWTVRDEDLNQLNFIPTDFAIDGIAAGSNNDLFLSSGSALYHYTVDGTLLGSFDYGDPALVYSDITVLADSVPEPTSVALLAAGLLGLGGLRLRRAR